MCGEVSNGNFEIYDSIANVLEIPFNHIICAGLSNGQQIGGLQNIDSDPEVISSVGGLNEHEIFINKMVGYPQSGDTPDFSGLLSKMPLHAYQPKGTRDVTNINLMNSAWNGKFLVWVCKNDN